MPMTQSKTVLTCHLLEGPFDIFEKRDQATLQVERDFWKENCQNLIDALDDIFDHAQRGDPVTLVRGIETVSVVKQKNGEDS
jgi:hypothetical protein